MLFTFMINWLFQSIDKISIKHWVNYEELGMYTSAFTLVGLLNVVQSAFTTFWTPVAFERFEKDPKDIKFFERMNKLISYVMLLIAILLILFKDIIILILGSKFKSAAFVMPFLVFMPVMYTISETTQIGINFAKRSNYHIIVAIVSLIFDIIGMYILVPLLGARGAAISTGFAYIVFFIMRTVLSLKFYKVNYNLKKFYAMTFLIAGYALYATFNSINLIYIFTGVVEILILSFFYKDVVKEIVYMLLNFGGKYLDKNSTINHKIL